jgi:hypothetical protein
MYSTKQGEVKNRSNAQCHSLGQKFNDWRFTWCFRIVKGEEDERDQNLTVHVQNSKKRSQVCTEKIVYFG